VVESPVHREVDAGSPVVFSVEADGTPPLTFQWRRDGEAIPGAREAVYRLAAATLADDGAVFDVVVTNERGSATSEAAPLTVRRPAAPTIESQPEDQTVARGETATFEVRATGAGPLAFQWRRDGVPIPHATGASYRTPAAEYEHHGATFEVVVSNPGGSVTSMPARFEVLRPAPPTIVTPPVTQVVFEGEDAVFSVTAAGAEPLEYLWRRDGIPIDGATGPSVRTPPAAPGDDGALFDVVVTNPGGSVTSEPASLVVLPPEAPRITRHPASVEVAVGAAAEFSVSAEGDGALTYQWRRNGTPITGAGAATYRLAPAALADSGARFDVVVRNAAASVTSDSATLSVRAGSPPRITREPADVVAFAGEPAEFQVSAEGSEPLIYQWRRDDVPIPGATAAVYRTPPVALLDDGATFYARVTNPQGVAHSTAARLTVRERPASATRVTRGVELLFRFEEGAGLRVADVSGVEPAIDLTIPPGAPVTWTDAGLRLDGPTLVSSTLPPRKLRKAVEESGEITIEAWFTPAEGPQSGPARIVTVSDGEDSRNLTVGQGLWDDLASDVFDVRLRTSETSSNGLPSVSTPPGSARPARRTHLVATRDATGTLRVYVDGTLSATESLPGELTNWNKQHTLLLGNEGGAERPWRGELHLVAFYSRALAAEEVRQNFDAGAGGR
jgi:hypothetical protein